MKEKVYVDWSVSDLLDFPKLEPALEKEKYKQKEQHSALRKESKEREEREIVEKLQRIDVQMNLERMMQQDQKYIGLSRRKPLISDFFSKVTMNRIFHDAHLLMKCEKNEAVQAQLKKRFAATIHNYFPGQGRPCDRYVKHDLRFERNESVKANDFGIEFEDEKEKLRDRKLREERMLNKLPKITNDIKQNGFNNSSENLKGAALSESSDDENADTKSSDKTKKNLTKSFSFSVLKPKGQVAQTNHLKLPKLE